MKVGATLIMTLMLAAFAPGIAFAGAADTDGDGIADDVDTCPLTANPIQTTPDDDGDGVPDACDNCQFLSNPNQCDSNEDGFGNACDQDLGGAGTTGIVNNADLNNGAFGFLPNFGSTGGPCTVDQDFDDTTLNDNVNNVDLNNPIRGFLANFLERMDGGVAASCPGVGTVCRSGMTCAVLGQVPGGCAPEVGPFAP